MELIERTETLKNYLTSKGYTNLRVENVRAEYILADKDGRTFCYNFEQIEAMAKE